MFEREGYPIIAASVVLAIALYALALRFRSWPLWLLAFVATIGATLTTWFFRTGTVPGAVVS